MAVVCCKSCRALWFTGNAQAMLENGETCLSCGGELELSTQPEDGA